MMACVTTFEAGAMDGKAARQALAGEVPRSTARPTFGCEARRESVIFCLWEGSGLLVVRDDDVLADVNAEGIRRERALNAVLLGFSSRLHGARAAG